MRSTLAKIVLLATLPGWSSYRLWAGSPQSDNINMEKMTVAELEKAGDQARAEKDYNLAIDYFQAALRKDRKNAVLLNKVGLSQLRKNDLDAARSSFEKSVRLNSKYAEAVNNVGAVDYMKKNYGSATKYFKKAIALHEAYAPYHINLGAAWFSQKKLDRAIAEYTRAMELDPDAFRHEANFGITAQIASPEERAHYSYLLAKIYAQRGDPEHCLQCLKRAKEDGYRNLENLYKDEAFSQMWQNSQLHEIVPPPAAK